MPEKMMPEEEGMDSLYSEDNISGGKSENPETIDQEEREESANSDIIKTSVLQSGPDDKVEPGDERVLKVVEVYGDTCKVIYAPKEEKETPAEEKSPDEEIDQMSEEHEASMRGGSY